MQSKMLLVGLCLSTVSAVAQPPVNDTNSSAPSTSAAPSASPTTPVSKPEEKPIEKQRVLGVLPNYRTANDTGPFEPLTTRRKFYIATKDSTDYPVFLLAGAFAGLGQLTDSHEQFGQGMKGYGKRYAASIADQMIGNYMTEAILPSLFHEDPRYFRRGHGRTMGRLAYAATRIFVTHTDSGGTRFNYSEVLGNAFTAGIANAYYPGERKLKDNFNRLSVQLGTDSISQVLKEFWPDIKKKWFKK
jgi:hypothetical protein